MGVVVTPLPIPLGLLMIAMGLALLAHDSKYLRAGLRKLRSRYPVFSGRLRRLEPHLGQMFRALLRRTDPQRLRRPKKP